MDEIRFLRAWEQSAEEGRGVNVPSSADTAATSGNARMTAHLPRQRLLAAALILAVALGFVVTAELAPGRCRPSCKPQRRPGSQAASQSPCTPSRNSAK